MTSRIIFIQNNPFLYQDKVQEITKIGITCSIEELNEGK